MEFKGPFKLADTTVDEVWLAHNRSETRQRKTEYDITITNHRRLGGRESAAGGTNE